MIEGYRKEWNDPELPVNIVQLPNFTIDNDPDSEAWQGMREVLRRLPEQIQYCDSVVAIDLGEDNDLHPLEKRELGRRLALLAAKNSCSMDIECHGPSIKKFMCVKNGEEAEITLNMSDTAAGLEAREANGKGGDGRITDFILVDDAGNQFRADAEIHKDKLILKVTGLSHSVKEIRYCYAQTNSGALIYNSEGLPMSPGIYLP
jgi:sialate O-acetylesterase